MGTPPPTGGPSPPSSGSLRDVGNPPQQPLQACEGDCDRDEDCAGSLVCFQRGGTEPVPGCTGTGTSDFDYCHSPPPPTPSPPPGIDQGKVLKVVSYNTLYSNFPCCGGSDWKVGKLGDTIVALDPAIVGTQETQDRHMLERKADGFKLVPNTGGNPIYYDSRKVSFQGDSGHISIPRDNYAYRTITYAKFKLG